MAQPQPVRTRLRNRDRGKRVSTGQELDDDGGARVVVVCKAGGRLPLTSVGAGEEERRASTGQELGGDGGREQGLLSRAKRAAG